MKNFNIIRTDKLLILKRSLEGRTSIRGNIIFSALAISFFLVFLINLNFDRIGNMYVIFGLIFLSVLSGLFYKEFFEKPVRITKKEIGCIIGKGKNIWEGEVTSILVEEYISSDAITGITSIKLKVNNSNILLFKGVSASDCDKILIALLDFLNLNHSIIKRVVT